MAFRKRKKNKKNGNTLIQTDAFVAHFHDDNDEVNEEAHNGPDARMESNESTIAKKKKHKNRIKIKAAQRKRPDTASNDAAAEDPIRASELASNVRVYTQEYLDTLKQETHSVAKPSTSTIAETSHIDVDSLDAENGTQPIVIDDETHDSEHQDEKVVAAKILMSKLQRRSQALSNAIAEHDNKPKPQPIPIPTQSQTPLNTAFGAHDMRFEPLLGKISDCSRRQAIQEQMDGHYQSQLHAATMDEDNGDDDGSDDFEMQQMQKSGIKLVKETITLLDDDHEDEDDVGNEAASDTLNVSKSRQWNVWGETDDALNVSDAMKLIDDDADVNANQSSLHPSSLSFSSRVSYEEIEAEYHDVERSLDTNAKQTQIMREKHLFFEHVNNECTAYLNCLSEKAPLIAKYVAMNQHLREIQYECLRTSACLQMLEHFQQAFYPHKFAQDLKVASMYAKISHLNESIVHNDGNEQSSQQQKQAESVAWNAEQQTFDMERYLLHKKQRSEQRKRVQGQGVFCYANPANVLIVNNNYCKKREKLLQEVTGIFDDTRMQYRSFQCLTETLHSWKKQYRSSYEQAHVSECIPVVIAPFVTLELLQWNALKCRISVDRNSDNECDIVVQARALIELAWYRLMASYGTDEKGEIHANDADDLIVPTLIASLVIPELVQLIRYDWNAYSVGETKQLLMQINTAWQHLYSYPKFAPKKQSLLDALKERCNEAVVDLMSCAAIPSWVMTKIVPKHFKQIATKPLDVLDVNLHAEGANLPDGDMYEYVKNRVLNAMQLLQNVSLIMLKNELDDFTPSIQEWLLPVTRNIYHSLVEPFVTFLARSPAKHAKEDMNAQMNVLRDLRNVFEQVSEIQQLWSGKQGEEHDDDDEDIRMKTVNTFPDSIVKHIKRSLGEIKNNINDSIRSHENVIQILNSLHNLCI